MPRRPLDRWLDERLVADPAARELQGDLYRDFKAWCAAKPRLFHRVYKPMSLRAFADALGDRQILLVGKNAKGLKYLGPARLRDPNSRTGSRLDASKLSVWTVGEPLKVRDLYPTPRLRGFWPRLFGAHAFVWRPRSHCTFCVNRAPPEERS
jgi:hypothetical protein